MQVIIFNREESESTVIVCNIEEMSPHHLICTPNP